MSSPIFEEEMSYKGKKLLQDTRGSALRVFMCHRYLFLSNFMTFQENAMEKQDSNMFSQKAGRHHSRNLFIVYFRGTFNAKREVNSQTAAL